MDLYYYYLDVMVVLLGYMLEWNVRETNDFSPCFLCFPCLYSLCKVQYLILRSFEMLDVKSCNSTCYISMERAIQVIKRNLFWIFNDFWLSTFSGKPLTINP